MSIEEFGRMSEKKTKRKFNKCSFLNILIIKGKYLEGKDLGDWVVFLAGNGGGKFMTGQSIVIDGGHRVLGVHLKRGDVCQKCTL